ncbi:MAG TPA: YqaJ viral recombinase family protein [Patescibacteria group bacterium]|nr:YqaJ viral recombinase family protein [Patescibacteria group bacterium]
MIHHEIDQNSEEWDALRLGKFTSSTFADLFMKKDTKRYRNAIIKVAFERVTGECEENYSNKWMQRGNEKEPFAVENYELFTFNTCEPAGFYEYDEFTGASPDRKIIGLNGGCEFKCPSFQIYNEYLETGKVPKDYYWQIIGQLLCTGWDFIDYMPYSSPKLKQILIRIERAEHEGSIGLLKAKLAECIEEVKILIERIKQ